MTGLAQRILETIDDGFLLVEYKTQRIVYCNPAMARMLGYSDEELCMTSMIDILTPEFFGRVVAQFEDQGKERKTGGEMIAFRRKDGSSIDVAFNAVSIRVDGRDYHLGRAHDSMGPDMVEMELERFRSFPQSNPNPVIEFNSQGELRYQNSALDRLVELAGVSDSFEIMPRDVVELVRNCSKSGEHLVDIESVSRGRTIDWSFIPIQKTKTVHAYARDITDRLALEAALLEAHKIEALGRLAGGVAHDFNNQLSAILGLCELAISALPPDHPVVNDIYEIQAAAEKSASLTKQLLAFGRKQVLQPLVLDFNAVVVKVQKFLRRLMHENIQVVVKLSREGCRIKGDPIQMDQIVMNLVINARDSMTGGGKIIVETSRLELREVDQAAHPEVSPGTYVVLSVQDFGHGMDKETQSKVFEPFFSTKEAGSGTGLGLAMVHGIVKQSGGHIWIHSELGVGTTFKVYFPAVEDAVANVGDRMSSDLPRGTETILLVEDETAVRAMATRALGSLGYHVLVAADGEEAIRTSSPQEKKIDLLITDVLLPKMDGVAVAQRIQRQRKEMKVIYISGYAESVVAKQGVLPWQANFLPKPIMPSTLARTIRDVLDRSPEPGAMGAVT